MSTQKEWYTHDIPQGNETGYSICDQNDPKGRDIAFLYPASEARKNATLIAAAPDLLDALQELEEQAHSIDAMQHAGLEIPPEDWSNLNTLCNAARAAINKAGGYDS